MAIIERGIVDLRRRLGEAATAASARVTTLSPSTAVGTSRETIQSRLAALPMPAAPAVEPWEVSAASLVTSSGNGMAAAAASRALRLLNRFGRVAVSPQGVGLDDEDVPWVEVRELRSGYVRDVMTRSAFDREIQRLQKLLPPMPGRSWVVGRIADVLRTLLDRALPTTEGGRVVVTGLTYTGRRGETKTVDGGFASILLLAVLPAVDRSIRETAALFNVPATGPKSGSSAYTDRASIADLSAQLDTLSAEG